MFPYWLVRVFLSGACASTMGGNESSISRHSHHSMDPVKRHREIEKQLKEDQRRELKHVKILLLGAGDSGKTTIVKQMKIIHTGGFDQREMEHQRNMVIDNTFRSMRTIIEAMRNLSIPFESTENSLAADHILKTESRPRSISTSSLTDQTQRLTHDVGDWACVKSLWADGGVQKCYRRYNEYQLIDSAKYFLDNIDRISQSDYKPTHEDILHTRAPTVGIVELSFPFHTGQVTIIDVGGQRSQRKKWIHCFDGVQAMIFVAALSEYNQVLYEDSHRNRMIESLKLFEIINATQWFVKTPILLFLNKKDLFKERLESFPLSDTFPDYSGGPDYHEAVKYIQTRFRAHVQSKLDRVYVHKTCATDTDNIKFVMNAAFDIVFNDALTAINLQ